MSRPMRRTWRCPRDGRHTVVRIKSRGFFDPVCMNQECWGVTDAFSGGSGWAPQVKAVRVRGRR